MSMLDPVRAGADTLVGVLQSKMETADPKTGVITITTKDMQELIDAIKAAKASLPPTLPFGM
jgi:hypothetical protein